jgi:hypothetical protein
MSRVRWLAIVLIASLLVVPAAARAAQTLDPGRRASTTSNFSKCDDVPAPVVIVRDSSCTSIDIDALLHPIARSVVAFDHRLPTSPDPLGFDFLRGPPFQVTLG